MYGQDYAYADSRLTQTIVRHGEEPVFIEVIRHDGVAVARKLSNIGQQVMIALDDLNLKPVSLGFCNFDGVASYLTRMPMRRDWRQGLRVGNFRAMNGIRVERIPPEVLDLVIKGVYPTFEECVASVLEGKASSKAWCRQWSIKEHSHLKYKMEGKVGVYKDGAFMLDKKFEYLRECLMESIK